VGGRRRLHLQRGGLPGHPGRAPDQLGCSRTGRPFPLEQVPPIRDEIKRSVEPFVAELDREAIPAHEELR
jgi:hypothetical protein